MKFVCKHCGKENIEEIKKCIKCGEEKGVMFFYRDKRSVDGFRGECKECFKKTTVSDIKKVIGSVPRETLKVPKKEAKEDKGTKGITLTGASWLEEKYGKL